MGRLETKILGVIIFVLAVGCIFAIGVVVSLFKVSLNDISSHRVKETAEVIAKNIEMTMIEGKADVTKTIVNDLSRARGIEEIGVYNSEGRKAFTTTGPIEELAAIDLVRKNKETMSVSQDDILFIYRPLLNIPKCQQCHSPNKIVLGAVKVTVPLDKEKRKIAYMFWFSVAASIIAIVGLSLLLRGILRRLIIRPVDNIEKAAAMLAEGDLSFSVDIKTRDEVGRLSRSVRDSLYSISSILKRIQDVSGRISNVAAIVENESKRVLEGTQLESEAIENISSSVEELNASIAEISEGTDSLAASVEETAASMEEMSVNINQITENTSDLFTAVEDSSSAIEEMSSTIKAVADSADKLSVSSEDTFSAIEELNSSIREVERNSKESADLSQKVVEDATRIGLPSVEKTVTGMNRIKEAVEKTANIVRQLGDRSEEIGKIVNVIDGIAEQTTLLSLNAAILASQAGEHGKGFSVVADEIKELADRTSFSTQEIAVLIGVVQLEVSEAVNAMEEGVNAVEGGFKLASGSDDALRKIVTSAKQSSGMSSAIERATEQQANAVKLVAESMEKVKNMVSSIVRATSEQSKGASLIMHSAEKVRDITTRVKNASEEQSLNSRQVSKAMEMVSEKTQQISLALREEKEGAEQIKNAVAKIHLLPEQNRERAFTLNRSLKDLYNDAELVMTEMQRFKFQDARSVDVINFGVVPLESPAEMYNRFGPLINYLREKLEKRVELKVAVDFAGAVNDISNGVTQLCYMTPSTYIQAHGKAEIRVTAKAERDGKAYHHSVIVVNAKKGIERIEDIKGKSFAFGDMNSTSSHIVPRYMLMEAGITLDDLLYYNYLGRHDDVAKAVLSGDFDAGGIMETTALKYKGQGLKLLKFSEEIPEFNICVNKNFPGDELKKILDALFELKDSSVEGATILKSIDKNYTGFTAAKDGDYDGIREIMVKLNIL